MKKSRVTIYLYLFLFLVVAFVFYIDKDRHTEEQKTVTTKEVDTSIYEKESKTIKKLESYIVPIYYPYSVTEVRPSSQLMITRTKVTLEDLNDEAKLYVVLSYLDQNSYFEDKDYYQIYDDEGKELEKPKKISERKYDAERKDQIVYKSISTSKINKISQKIFNTEINIPNKITYDGNILCEYEEELECTQTYTQDEHKPTNYVQYVSSEVKDDELYIYQKYIRETPLNGVTSISTPFENISERYNVKEVTTGVLNKYGQTYKTTYKKNKDGNYYWYSTEPVLKQE